MDEGRRVGRLRNNCLWHGRRMKPSRLKGQGDEKKDVMSIEAGSPSVSVVMILGNSHLQWVHQVYISYKRCVVSECLENIEHSMLEN